MNKQIKTSALLGVCIVSLGVIVAFVGLFPNGTPHWITSQ